MFTSKKRETIFDKMSRKTYDLLVIGGGITGAGIALDATTRGLSTALVEMQDFAAGTSSRSTKLVHGGLRYLKQLEIKLVAEVGKERAIVYENGPHVTTPEWMLLPFHQGGTFGKTMTSIGLRLYDFLAGVKKEERRKMLSVEETLQKAPLLKKEGLKGGGYYVEYRTDDARLTIEVLKKAVEHGADAISYAQATNLLYQGEKVVGATIRDMRTGQEYEIRAKQVVNATGPWVDRLRDQDNPKVGKSLRLTKGVHVVIDQSRFPLKQAVYFDTPDGRMVFGIPRDQKAYVGTTDTVYEEDPKNPKISNEDRQYIIQAINYMFPEVNITDADIESSWAGVRPLIYEQGKDPSEISRKDEIWESPSGLLTIAGGKLTGYRKMAQDLVDLVAKRLEQEGRTLKACQTVHLPISGGDVGGSKGFERFIKKKVPQVVQHGFTKEQAEKLVHRYGSNIDRVMGYVDQFDPNNNYGLPLYVFVQIAYAIEQEMTTTPVDFFIRRTGALLFDIDWVRKWKDQVVDYMSDELGWSVDEKVRLKEELETEIRDATEAVG